MKKTTFQMLTSVFTMLALLLSLATVLTVGVFADAVPEAKWGTDVGNLTAEGTLQAAFDAASTDSSITYIQLVNDVDLGDGIVMTKGGAFTLDLNGHLITSSQVYTFYLDVEEGAALTVVIDDTSDAKSGRIYGSSTAVIVMDATAEINITLAGGTIEGGNYAIQLDSSGQTTLAELTVTGGALLSGNGTICTGGASVTVVGNAVQDDQIKINWATGMLDFSQYTGAGAVIANAADADKTVGSDILIPNGYSVYDVNDNAVTILEKGNEYTVSPNESSITLNTPVNGSVVLYNGDAPIANGEKLPTGTEVTVDVIPDVGYLLDEITVNGEVLSGNAFLMGEADAIVDVTFKPYQANWGADENNLSHSGTLQDALDAAAADPSVRYVQLAANVLLGSGSVTATGGNFTLDLYGYFLGADGTPLILGEGTDLTLVSTLDGGRIRGYYSIQAGGTALTLECDNLSYSAASIEWLGGTLNFSGVPDATGISIYNNTGETVTLPSDLIVFPQYYGLFEKGTTTRATALLYGESYTFDVLKYELTVTSDDGVGVTTDPAEGQIAVGTTVTVELAFEDFYTLVSIKANGGDVELSYDEETDAYSFVMPEQDVELVIETKFNALVWGETAETMTETGDFWDLVFAINAGNAPFAKLLADYNVDFSADDVTLSGTSVIDLNGYTLNLIGYSDSLVILGQNADITFTDSKKTEEDRLYPGSATAFFDLQAGSKLTVKDAAIYGDIYYTGGKLDLSKASFFTEIRLCNMTEKEVALTDFITMNDPFRAIDEETWNSDTYTGYTVPTLSALPTWEDEPIFIPVRAVYDVSFDFGEGSGKMPTTQIGEYYSKIPIPEEFSHPNGLVWLGWIYTFRDYEMKFYEYFYHEDATPPTLKAVWGAPLYIGNVAMFDGDYLASGATETTRRRPVSGGYAYYKDGVLTLNNFQFLDEGYLFAYDEYNENEDFALIYSANDLVIELIGSSTLEQEINVADPEDYYYLPETDGIRVRGTLTVRGEGSLSVKVNNDAIDVDGLTLESGTVTLISDDEAIEVDGCLTVKGGVMIAVSEDGVNADELLITGGELYVLASMDEWNGAIALQVGALTVEGGFLKVEGNAGIQSDFISINGGKVEVNSYYEAIFNFNSDGKDAFLNISGGKVTLYSEEYEAIDFCGKITVSGGVIDVIGYGGISVLEGSLTVSGGKLTVDAMGIGIDAYKADVMISGGEIKISDADIAIHLAYASLTVTDGMLAMNRCQSGLYATEATVIVSGGEISVGGCSQGFYLIETPFTFSDGKLLIEGSAEGIVAESSVITVFGGTLEIYAAKGIHAADSAFTLSGGSVTVICPTDAAVWVKDFTVSGGRIFLQTNEGFTVIADTVSLGGKETSIFATKSWEVTQLTVDGQELVQRTHEEARFTFFEGVGFKHTWKETFATEETLHWRECTDPNCHLAYFAKLYKENNDTESTAYMILRDFYSYYFPTESEFGTHSIPNGEENCSVCGYPEATKVEIPAEAVLLFGSEIFLRVGDYITADGKVVASKPEGGYLFVDLDDSGDTPLYKLVLHNFVCERTDIVMFYFLRAESWSVVLEGDSNLTLHALQNPVYNTAGAVFIFPNQPATFIGNGTLTLNASIGIITINDLTITDGASITVNANKNGIEVMTGSLTVAGATLAIRAEEDGIYAIFPECIFFGEKSIVTINAKDDGIDMSGGELILLETTKLTVKADDEGMNLANMGFYMQNAVLDITAGDDGIDGDNCIFEWNGSTVTVVADDNAITLTTIEMGSESCFNADKTAITLTAGGDAFRAKGLDEEYTAILNVDDCTVSLKADIAALKLEYASLCFDGCEVKTDSMYNMIADSTLSLDATKLNIFATQTGLALFSKSSFEAFSPDTEITVVSRDEGIFGLDSQVFVGDAKLTVEAVYRGIYGDMEFAVGGNVDVSVRALEAIRCASIEIDDTSVNHVMNAELYLDYETDGEAFYDEHYNYASYVTIRSSEVIAQEMDAAIERLDQLISEDGEIEAITDSIDSLNTLLDTLTNSEGEGRIDLIEKANEAINQALETLDDALAQAQKDLSDAIAKGDGELSKQIAELNDALADAEAAYAAADKELGDKLTEAQTTLDTAIKAVDKKLDETKTALDKAIADGDAALNGKIADLNQALDDTEAAYAAADKELGDKLTEAQTTLDTAIKAVDKKLDETKTALDKAIADGDTALDGKITALNKALADAKAANETANGQIKTELSGKIETAQASLATALTALQTELNNTKTELNNTKADLDNTKTELSDAKAEMKQQSIQGDDTLRAELAALKAELTDADSKSSTRQIIITVIAAVALAGNVGLVTAWILLERKKKLLASVIGGGASVAELPTEASEVPEADAPEAEDTNRDE